MNEPWVRFEDEHLLAVAKPAGVTTHRADVHTQDGMHEWVQRQRPTEPLSILHRLDKATSGILLFGKTTEANRALSAEFEGRTVAKRYELLVSRDARRPAEIRSHVPVDGQEADTDFARQSVGAVAERWSARPHTGRTHQVRVHATAAGMPILGDAEHHGLDAARLYLHAADLSVAHPDGSPLELHADRPASFDRAEAGADGPAQAATVAQEARSLLFDPADTDAYVWIDREHDGFADTRVERLGSVALVHRYGDDGPLPAGWLDAWIDAPGINSVYVQHRPRGGGGGLPQLAAGTAVGRFEVIELGLRYVIDLQASVTSSGLFLDQRETRRTLLSLPLAGRTVLNAFAHTGSLSVAAARAGAATTTLDLSRRYLDWARENLEANGLQSSDHDLIYGDALEWLERLGKRERTFDVVLVDPPSSSTPRKKGGTRWTVERDLHGLVERATWLVAPGGTLFVSTNLHKLSWPKFVRHVEQGVRAAGRHGDIDTRTLPLDHRSGPGDRPYLKTAWVSLAD